MLDEYELHNMILEVGAPGRSSLISGERGRGKTSLGVYLVEWLRQHPRDCELCRDQGRVPKTYWVFSNVIIKHKGGQEDYPERWIKVRSFAELVLQIGKVTADPNNRIIWLLDEGAAVISIYESVFTKKNRTMITFLTLARKMRLANIVITISPRLIHKQLRGSEGGFLAAVFRKEGRMVRQRAPHLLGKVDERSIVIVEWPELGDDYEVIIINTADPEGPSLAKPESMVEEGELVFDTLAAASHDMGTMPGTKGKPFQFDRLLSWVSDCQSELVPSRIIEYFKRQGEVEAEAVMDVLQPGAVVKGTKQHARGVTLPAVLDEIQPLLDEGIRAKLALAEKLRPILKEKYDLEISVDRLRKYYVPEATKRLESGSEGLVEEIQDTIGL